MVSVPSPRPVAGACMLFHFEKFLGCYLSAKSQRKMIKFLRRMPVCALIFQFSLFTFYPTYLGHFNSKMEIFDAHLDANQRWRTRVALRARSRRHARIPRLPKALKPGNESQLNLQIVSLSVTFLLWKKNRRLHVEKTSCRETRDSSRSNLTKWTVL